MQKHVASKRTGVKSTVWSVERRELFKIAKFRNCFISDNFKCIGLAHPKSCIFSPQFSLLKPLPDLCTDHCFPFRAWCRKFSLLLQSQEDSIQEPKFISTGTKIGSSLLICAAQCLVFGSRKWLGKEPPPSLLAMEFSTHINRLGPPKTHKTCLLIFEFFLTKSSATFDPTATQSLEFFKSSQRGSVTSCCPCPLSQET